MKFLIDINAVPYDIVALLVSAWIEIIVFALIMPSRPVALLVSAWIEMSHLITLYRFQKSHSS